MKFALIIEDDLMMQDLLCELLEKMGFTVESAEDGWDGVGKIKKSTYDLILLDIKMPGGIDGEQVLNIIRKFKISTPIVIVSAFLTKERILKLKQLGVKGFLAKPVDINKFPDMINEVCSLEVTPT